MADTILYHHERPDGEGYYGLASDEIPLAAKILAVAEVYDAMTSSRVRGPLSARRRCTSCSTTRGASLDADCVEALVDKLSPRPETIPLMPPA